MKSFKAVLEQASEGMDAAYVTVPFSVEKVFGTRGQLKVNATFDGHPYRGSLATMGGGVHVIGVRKDIRTAIGKKIGDMIAVTIERDNNERVVDVPDDLKALLAKNQKAQAFYDTLSYTNRKEYAVWITSAKKQETRDKRLKATLEKLKAEKKNPGS